MVQVQNLIVDLRYKNAGCRTFQNYVGKNLRTYGERMHVICPRPQDLEATMTAWMQTSEGLRGADPVVAAAVLGFGLVFIRPFEDGNGRIHRCLIHRVLKREVFAPSDILLPISAPILRDRTSCDVALEMVSSTVIENATVYLYRCFDGTELVRFLREELTFMATYHNIPEAIVIDGCAADAQ